MRHPQGIEALRGDSNESVHRNFYIVAVNGQMVGTVMRVALKWGTVLGLSVTGEEQGECLCHAIVLRDGAESWWDECHGSGGKSSL